MKKVVFIALIIVGFNSFVYSQNDKIFPNKKVYNLEGKEFLVSEIYQNEGNPIVIDFWATWCKPCLLSIKYMHENYEEWQKQTDVKIILISIDEEKMISKIQHMAELKGWKFDLYIDKNLELKESLGFNQIPQTFLVNDQNGEILWHEEFAPGDENKLFKQIKKYSKK